MLHVYKPGAFKTASNEDCNSMTSVYLNGVYYSKLIYCLFYEGGSPNIPIKRYEGKSDLPVRTMKRYGGLCALASLYEQRRDIGPWPPCTN